VEIRHLKLGDKTTRFVIPVPPPFLGPPGQKGILFDTTEFEPLEGMEIGKNAVKIFAGPLSSWVISSKSAEHWFWFTHQQLSHDPAIQPYNRHLIEEIFEFLHAPSSP